MQTRLSNVKAAPTPPRGRLRSPPAVRSRLHRAVALLADAATALVAVVLFLLATRDISLPWHLLPTPIPTATAPTAAPAFDVSSANVPMANTAVVKALVANAIVANGPAPSVPAVNAPVANATVVNGPAPTTPAINAPVANATLANAPAPTTPAANAPVANAPLVNAPAANIPVAKTPVASTPAGMPVANPPIGSGSTNAAAVGVEADSNFDAPEKLPSPGVNQLLSDEEVRYCVFQGRRLGFLHSQITSSSSVQRFNTLEADFNSRCTRFRFKNNALQAALDLADARQVQLRADATSILSSWSPTP